ncbi:MAG: PilN domain-containing protein [Candidatus Eisenbacteria bacterium]|nr:PilN domain-containing protein [Candidatus Eisenbacteria bacterium]
MTRIDLIPPETLTARGINRRLRVWGKRLGLLAVAATALLIGMVHAAAGEEARLLKLTGRYSLLQERVQRAESLIAERDRLARYREVIDRIRGDRTAVGYLVKMGETLTPDAYLSGMQMNLCPYNDSRIWGGLTDKGCSAHLRIEGLARGHREVGMVIRQMALSGEFGSVSLVSVLEKEGSSDGNVEFEIVCALDPGGGEQ